MVAFFSCGPEVTLTHEADAEVYVRAMCEDGVARYEECDPDPEGLEPFTLEECIETHSTFDDPCFAELDELWRCRFERLSCDELLSMDIDASPDSTCFEFLDNTSECRLRQAGQ